MTDGTTWQITVPSHQEVLGLRIQRRTSEPKLGEQNREPLANEQGNVGPHRSEQATLQLVDLVVTQHRAPP